MVKIEVAKGKVKVVSMGEITMIVAELCAAIASISEQIHSSDEEAGCLFELLMLEDLVSAFSDAMENRKKKGGDE